MSDLENLPLVRLLGLHADIMEELRRRGKFLPHLTAIPAALDGDSYDI